MRWERERHELSLKESQRNPRIEFQIEFSLHVYEDQSGKKG